MSSAYCLKCKKQTKSKNIELVKAGTKMREKSVCVVCKGNKSKFVSSQGGKGIEADLSKEAYADNPKEEIDGYKLDKELSNKKTKVYNNPTTNKTVIAHKGTDPKDKNDLKNDALLTVGLLDKSKRVKNAVEIGKKAEAKYKDSELTNVGHSLGGEIASQVGKKLSVKNSNVETFNKGSSPLDLPINLLKKAKCSVSNSNECKKLKNQTHNMTGVDPISISNITSVGKVKLTKPSKVNVHGIDNFTKK